MSKFTRRLQKIGSSILVSLPKQWVDDHNLVKSSQVQIETLENSLSITVGEGRKLSKEIEIEYVRADRISDIQAANIQNVVEDGVKEGNVKRVTAAIF